MFDLNNLYNSRKITDKKEQRKLLFSFFEWTYFFYVILPIGLFFLYEYIYTWIAHPHWVDMLQLPVVHLILFLVISSNSLRTYLKHADQLFLVRKISIMDTMVKKGHLKLVVSELFKVTFAIIIILPYLTFHLNKTECFLYIVMIILFNLFYTLYLYSSWRSKWLSILLFLFYLFAGIHFELWLPISVVSFGLFVYLLTTIRYKNKPFSNWLEIEYIKGSSMSRWLLRIASFTMKKNGIEVIKGHSRMNQIMMYHLSIKRRLFKNRSQKQVLLESFFKWFYRQPKYWTYFFLILAVNSSLLFVNNVWIIIAFSTVCCFVMNNTLKILWTRFLTHPFMNLYRWKESMINKARRITQIVLLVVYCIFLISAITIFNTVLFYSY